MTDGEIKATIELAAKEAAEEAIRQAKELWKIDISLHSAQCEANKYRGIKNLLSAIVGGIIVAVVTVVLRKI
jgi:hypothetical protein